jgi:phospholipase A1
MRTFTESLSKAGCFVVLFCISGYDAHSKELTEYEECLVETIIQGSENTTSKNIKEFCSNVNKSSDYSNKPSAIKARKQIESSNLYQQFSIMAYKPNYILPVTYNGLSRNSSVYQQQFNNQDISFDNVEAQFQISIKVPIMTNIFKSNISLLTGYTSRSFWQVYNKELSSPFRETNHEPELWIQKSSDIKLLGFTNISNKLGISHQSNGRGGALSRSWNRAYADFIFERKLLVISMKVWTRIKEDAKDDDNPDITDYLGHGELRAVYAHKNQTFSVMSRNNLESGFDRGSVEISWSFPLGERKDLKGYMQIFSGYGESLIDYNNKVNTIGVGVSVSDWL